MHSALSSGFPISQGNAEAQVIWGGTVKQLLIADLIGNISAEKILKSVRMRQTIASQRWDVLRHGVEILTGCYSSPSSLHD